MFGYRVPAPDEAMLISGRGGSPQGAPFRVVIGHGAFVTPVFLRSGTSPCPCRSPRSPRPA